MFLTKSASLSSLVIKFFSSTRLSLSGLIFALKRLFSSHFWLSSPCLWVHYKTFNNKIFIRAPKTKGCHDAEPLWLSGYLRPCEPLCHVLLVNTARSKTTENNYWDTWLPGSYFFNPLRWKGSFFFLAWPSMLILFVFIRCHTIKERLVLFALHLASTSLALLVGRPLSPCVAGFSPVIPPQSPRAGY